MSHGKYIVIEGNDGTGKSTQAELLCSWLNQQGIETFEVHEPSGVPIADAIRTVIKDGTLERDGITNLLLFSAARHEIWLEAKRAIKLGSWVVSARNYFSTIAYQHYGEGIDNNTIIQLSRQATDDTYMNPDYAVILTLDSESRRERIASRGVIDTPDTFESKKNDFQARVDNGYLEIAKQYSIKTIDARQNIEAIQSTIRENIAQLLVTEFDKQSE